MRKLSLVLSLLMVFILLSCSNHKEKCLIDYVDMMIGTKLSTLKTIKPREGSKENNGQVIPAVTAPFGMTQWTPQTQETEVKCLAPFYSDAEICRVFVEHTGSTGLVLRTMEHSQFSRQSLGKQ